MAINERQYAKQLEKDMEKKGKGLTVAGHKRALKKAEYKPRPKVDNEGWIGKLTKGVKTVFAERRFKKERERQRQFRLEQKRKRDEAIIAKARKQGKRV